MLKISRHNSRIIESPSLIRLYLSLAFQSFSQKVHVGPSKAPGSSLAPSWSWWERRRWDASIWNSVVHQTLQSRMVGVRRQPRAQYFYRSLCSWLLCVIVPFIYGFLWLWGMLMNIMGALMSVMNSRHKRCCWWDCEYLIPPSRFLSHSCSWVLGRCQAGHAHCWSDDWGHRHLRVLLCLAFIFVYPFIYNIYKR